MNSKTTGLWFVLAVILFAFIFIFQHYFRAPANTANAILPGLRPPSVTSVQVFPAGAIEIRADYTNNSWQMTQPITYPAQSAAIETLLAALQKLMPSIPKIGSAELLENKNSDSEFGFDNPQTRLVIEEDDQSWQLTVGNKTAPGDQVYLRVVGVDGVFVADAGWLKYLPRSTNDWRSTTLVDADENQFDSIVLTNGTKVIELRRDATNRLWRMIRPLQARADTDRITDALQRLQAARVTQFVTDDPKADLTSFGLQPADLDLWLGHGTNLTAGIHAGKSPADDSTQVYAKRDEWDAVVTTPMDSFSPWHGAVNDFRDPHLLELTAPVAEIEVADGTNGFTLQRQGSNDWRVAGEKFPVDTDSVQDFLKALAGTSVARFVEDVATAPDLPKYGLAMPQRQITLRSAIGDTNAVIAQLQFGTNQNNEVFVRRADEASIYSITAEDFNRVDEADWEFRERQIWNFTPNDVAEITLHQNGRTRQLIHNGREKWSLAAGSQGVIEGKYIEQSAQQLGGLTAYGWVGRNVTNPEQFGFNTNNLQIVVELKSGQKLSVDFGVNISNQTALAATTLDGERWAFIFPPGPYLFVLSYLTIPANVP